MSIVGGVTLSLLSLCISFYVYPQQRINDFYLSNYDEDGRRKWEIKGKEAVVHGKYVDINKMRAKYYAGRDIISIKSKKAQLNKGSLNVFLKEDVSVENTEGVRLITDSLNWRRDDSKIETNAWVEAHRANMQVRAKGLNADTQFKKIDFQEDVEVNFPSKEGSYPTTITCNGPLEIRYNEGKAVFNENVVVKDNNGTLFSDKVDVFFDKEKGEIIKIICKGKVKIIRNDNVVFAQKATYLGEEEKVILEGNPRLIYFPSRKDKADF
jgi:LPS export ABC transporter protein LptC